MVWNHDIFGIVLATGIYMVIANCVIGSKVKVQLQAVIITVLLVMITVGYKYFKKKKMSSIMLIVISAIAGVVIYGI